MVIIRKQLYYGWCLLSFILVNSSFMTAQISPMISWTFDSNNSVLKNGTPTEIGSLESNYSIESENNVSFISVQPETQTGLLRFAESLPDNFSLSFWIRVPESGLVDDMRLFWTQDNSMIFRLSNRQMSFQTRTKDGSGDFLKDNWLIPFSGNGVESFSNLMDNRWHQLLLQYNSRTGEKSVYIDGQKPDSWTKSTEIKRRICGAIPCNSSLQFNHARRTNQIYQGDLALINVYNQYISPAIARDLYNREVTAFNGQRTSPVRSRNLAESAPFDLREFAQVQAGKPQAAAAQLSNFQLPRYLPGHGLLPNFNWIDPVYMSGYTITDNNARTSAARMVKMSEELWTNWHYTLTISTNLGYKLKNERRDEHIKALIHLANQHPELPVSLITMWINVKPKSLNGGLPGPNISQRQFDTDYYLRQSNGRYLKTNGVSSSPALFSPLAPKSLWSDDGANQQILCAYILDKLTRPVEFVNENGEVQPWPMEGEVLKKDPAVREDFESSGIATWEEYTSVWKTGMRSAYRDGYMNHPKLRSAHYSWYAIDGGPYNRDRFEWETARTAMRPINGQYYSTPNFYVRTPDNWEKWKGPWRGWEWISISRKVELASGDELFSPFVAAGWNKNPEVNVRPSQWLGLLKCLGVVGAEFYYPSVFNQNSVSNFPNPDHYIWQAAMPAYAQAVTSRYEEILRDGSLLLDNEGVPLTEYACSDPRVLFTARKHQSREEYILCGTIQPISNVPGNVPDDIVAKVVVDNMKIRLPVRRQGSVYHLNMENPSTPIIRQLDKWHESGHPSWWSENFFFEAEVADFVQDCRTRTEGVNDLDLSDFTTYIQPDGEDPCVKYHFTPREEADFKLEIRARGGSRQASIQVMIDDRVVGTISIPAGNNWQTVNISNSKLKNLSASNHVLSLRLTGSDLAVDTVELIKL